MVPSDSLLRVEDFLFSRQGIWVQDFKPLKSRPSENSDFGSQWEFILQVSGGTTMGCHPIIC